MLGADMEKREDDAEKAVVEHEGTRTSQRIRASRGRSEEKRPEPKKTAAGRKKNASISRPRKNATGPRRNAVTSLPKTTATTPPLAAKSGNKRKASLSIDSLQEEPTVCLACYRDDAEILCILSCGHSFCHSCATSWLKQAIHNEERYPARCCYDWDLEIEKAKEVPEFRAVAEEYERKAIEWKTSNRTYCANPHCAKFLGGDESPNLHCDVCNISTCVQCKSKTHPEGPCPRDEETERMLQMADVQDWRRCPKCRNVVVKAEGCNSLVCRCGERFCYKCGASGICSCFNDVVREEAARMRGADRALGERVDTFIIEQLERTDADHAVGEGES